MSKNNEPNWITLYRDKIIKPNQRTRITEQRGRTKESQSGDYATKAWIQVRDKRRAENPLCQECERKGMIRPMKIVDHVISVEERPDLFLDFDNTQSLCDFHHILKTNADKKRKNEAKRLESGRKLMQDLATGGG